MAYAAFMTPTIHWFLWALGSFTSVLMPNSIGNDRFAPFDPVWSQPLYINKTRSKVTKTLWHEIHKLNGSSQTADNDCQIQVSRLTPSIWRQVNFVMKKYATSDERVVSRRIIALSSSLNSGILSNPWGFWAKSAAFLNNSTLSSMSFSRTNSSTCSRRSLRDIPRRGFWILKKIEG